jgi:hypothetical protein
MSARHDGFVDWLALMFTVVFAALVLGGLFGVNVLMLLKNDRALGIGPRRAAQIGVLIGLSLVVLVAVRFLPGGDIWGFLGWTALAVCVIDRNLWSLRLRPQTLG